MGADLGAEPRAIRQLPQLDQLNRPFWTGGSAGQLLIACCAECQRYVHPPLPRCPACGADRIEPKSVSGRGTVAAFTVNEQPWVSGLKVPYVFAAVEIEEQERLHVISNIEGCDPAAVHQGMAVEVFFEPFEDIWLPLFRPAEPRT